MQIKATLARIALKALGPQYAAGLMIASGGRLFSWNTDDSQAYANKIVYSALNILVAKLTEPTFLVSVETNSKALTKYYSKSASNEQRRLSQIKAIKEVDTHPLIDLLETPNWYQSGIEFWEQFWFNYSLGDGYIFAEMPGEDSRTKGQPIALHAINRSRVEPIIGGGKYHNVIAYRVNLMDGTQVTIPVESGLIFHMKKWNPETNANGKGYSPVTPAGKAISKNEENQTAQGAAFVNGGRGVLFSSDLGSDKESGLYMKMPAEELSKLKETMQRDWSGAMNNQKRHFTNGMLTAQNYGDTMAEMDLINAEKSDWRGIYAIFGVPDVLCPESDSKTYDNQTGAYKSLVLNTALPAIKKRDMKFNSWIINWYPKRVYAVADLTEFRELAPDLKLLKDVYGDAPFLTMQEKRQLFQFGEDTANGDILNEYYIPSGYITLRSVSEVIEYTDPNKALDYRG